MKINEIENIVDNLTNNIPDKKKRRLRIRTKSRKVVAVSLVAILALSLIAGAAVLTSLSNTVTTTVTVESPAVNLFTRAAPDWSWGTDPITLTASSPTAPPSVFQIQANKQAPDNEFYKDNDHYGLGWNGAQIVGTLVAEIYCPQGIAPGDEYPGDKEFDSITIRLWGGGSDTYYDATGHVYDETYEWTDFNVERINDNHIRISGQTIILWDQWGYYGEVTVQFSQFATGAYTFTIEILP